MSSFVIGSSTYQKVAGAIAAISNTTGEFGSDKALYLYGYTSEKIKSDFNKLFKLNAHSVAIQYKEEKEQKHDKKSEEQKEFVLGEKLAKRKTANRETEKLLYGLNKFFQSILYQIEDDKDTKKAKAILSDYSSAILQALARSRGIAEDIDCWGEFNIN